MWVNGVKSKAKELQHIKVNPVLKIDANILKHQSLKFNFSNFIKYW